MAPRRRSTIRASRDKASEVPKSVELEQRVSRLELLVEDLREVNDVLTKCTIALQAHVDHLDARVNRR